jgi:hypothetical protein
MVLIITKLISFFYSKQSKLYITKNIMFSYKQKKTNNENTENLNILFYLER